MRKFRIEKIDDLAEAAKDFPENVHKTTDKTVLRYMNLGLIYEDLRTVVKMNSMLLDLLRKRNFYLRCETSKAKKRLELDPAEHQREIEIDNTLLIQSLFTTIFVTYAKWFTKSSAQGRIKLESAEVFKNSNDELKKLHQTAMDYRNFYLAHGGAKGVEATIPLLISDPDTGEDRLFAIPVKTRIPNTKLITKFDKLFYYCLEIVHGNMKKMKGRVIEIIKEKQTVN